MRLTLCLAACVAALPALAASPPAKQDKPAPDDRLKVVAYSESRIIDIKGAVGVATSIQFSAAEEVQDVSSSATTDIVEPIKGQHFIILKPKRAIGPSQLFVWTKRGEDGERLYAFSFEADESGHAPFVVKMTYPADVAAAQRAAAQRRQEQALADRAEALLRSAPSGPYAENRKYGIQVGQ